MHLTVGLILLAISVCLFLWVDKRKFERKNHAAVEEFESYTSFWKVKVLEASVGILRWILAILGAFYTAFGIFY